jgi:hypothetical protein
MKCTLRALVGLALLVAFVVGCTDKAKTTTPQGVAPATQKPDGKPGGKKLPPD